MAAKLTFQDVYNDELDISKLTLGSSNISVSTAAGVPSYDATVGSFHLDPAAGNLYRKTASGASNWVQISSTTNSTYINHVRTISLSSAVTSGGSVIGDLVGLYGAGAWAASNALSIAKTTMGGAGSANSGLVAGGTTAAAVTNLSELFNGSTWATGATLTIAKSGLSGMGSQNSGLVAGGFTNAVTNRSELFNGTSWASAATLSLAKRFASSAGSQNAGLVVGGDTNTAGGGYASLSELFNGTTWTASASMSVGKYSAGGLGTQNASLAAGGYTGAVTDLSELFNGSTWAVGPVLTIAKSSVAACGSQSAGMIAGGFTSAVTNRAELFNGSVWASGDTLTIAKDNPSGAGSQGAGFVAGGTTASLDVTNLSELHSQTTYRTMYPRYLGTAKSIGFLTSASTVLLQGQNTSLTYPANKWLVMNRSAICSVTNEVSFVASLTISSVQGTAPIMTYNLATTANILALSPGMVLTAVSNGATPISSPNTGAFVISRVVNPSSIEIQNSLGVAENPGTGYLTVLSTVLAVTSTSPQDIILGRTDANGNLFLDKPITVGSIGQRLK